MRGAPGAEARQPGHIAGLDPYGLARRFSDAHLQCVELLRDTSHVRNYGGEWIAALARSGFALQAAGRGGCAWIFPSVTAPACARRTTIAGDAGRCKAAASAETRAHFAIEADGSFLLDILMMETTAEGA